MDILFLIITQISLSIGLGILIEKTRKELNKKIERTEIELKIINNKKVALDIEKQYKINLLIIRLMVYSTIILLAYLIFFASCLINDKLGKLLFLAGMIIIFTIQTLILIDFILNYKFEKEKRITKRISELVSLALKSNFYISTDEPTRNIKIIRKDNNTQLFLLTGLEKHLTFNQFEEEHIKFKEIIKGCNGDFKLFKKILDKTIKEKEQTKKQKILNKLRGL